MKYKLEKELLKRISRNSDKGDRAQVMLEPDSIKAISNLNWNPPKTYS